MSRATCRLPDEQLLRECRIDYYRGSGPGGQKRNKTSNAVRIVHTSTGVTATATESRSLVENKLWAIRRLRIKLAADVREPIDLATFAPPDWLISIRRDRRLELSHRHPLYAATAGLTLDLLAALAGNPAAVAVNLGVTTSAVLKLLAAESAWWAAANRVRAGFGLAPLDRR